jgi:uncharacterized iron-regulated membrane protein
LLRREWFNAGNFTKAVSAATAIFMLIVVALGTFTGRDAVLITTFSILPLLALAVEGIVLWRRRRRLLPPSDDT